jgi:hydrogenase maturation protein HypF
MEWNWESLVRQTVVDRVQGVASPVMAMRFHRALAVAIATFAQATGRNRLSLSGGVFQNQLLVELLVDQLHESPIQVTLPASIPVNDGGLAAGQLVAALQYLHQG